MMYLGVDYYPEHWDLEMMEHDLERIVALGANTVRIGEFAWHLMEATEGRYDFSYFDQAIQKMKAYGLNVIFGTPTTTFPAWLAKKYPEILSVDAEGQKRVFGGRRQYCYNSEIYSVKSSQIVTALLTHYQSEPAIVAWQIDNELGHEGSDQCYCESCHKGFQTFLKEKYVDIEVLNRTYGAIFWGQTYNDFDEIPMPLKTITTHNPTLQLDWARFRSKSINDYAKMQIDIVNKLKRPQQNVIHNFFGGFFERAYDQNLLASRLDRVAYDNYPVWGGLEKPISPANIAMTHDYIRGLKRENFWIVEELMGAQGHTVIGYLPRPNQAKMWSYQAMARGCEALLYFRWRGMTHGAEQFCQGILDQDDQINEKYREVKAFFDDIKRYEVVLSTPILAEVAVLYDYDNRWSWQAQSQSHAFDFTNELLRVYEGFYTQNIHIDVIDIKKSWDQYKVIALPVMQIVDDALLMRLKAFAEKGGQVIFSFRSGIKNRDNNLRLGENILNELCGVKLKNYESLGLNNQVKLKTSTHEAAIGGATMSVWRDLLEPTTAEVIYRYDDLFFDQYAAITKNSFGDGTVYYVGGGLSQVATNALIEQILKETGILTHKSAKGLEVVRRNSGEDTYLFIMNHTESNQSYLEHTVGPYESRIINLAKI
ncbi:beta-galactosidase [Fusibacter sp. 3D3]|uniref:beta-galactosidase n=1 Tax=Fusibacter sp. 3D3 TaxID=1048380 RepID=UPI0008576841|nr:beta-galactosidase [Fusibacter sp. 3D3]GAU77582.1 beta-galactosidase [Fusibacter sp. 3D3]